MGFIKQGRQTGNGTTRLEKWVGLKLYPFVFVNEDIRMFPLEADKFILSFIFGFDFVEQGDDGWVDSIPLLFREETRFSNIQFPQLYTYVHHHHLN